MLDPANKSDGRGSMIADLKVARVIVGMFLAFRTVGLVFLPTIGAARESQILFMAPFTPFDGVRVAIGLGVIPLYGYWRHRSLNRMEWSILAVAGVHGAFPLSAMNGLISWSGFVAYRVVDWLVVVLALLLITLALRERMRLRVSTD